MYKFIKIKYKWTTHTIQDIEWRLHSTQYNKLPSTGKRNEARFIHHRLPSGNMVFANHLVSLTLKLDKFYTPPFLRDTIINSINQYYNNGLVDDLPEYTITPFNHTEIKQCNYLQNNIGWDHFIRARMFKPFYSPLNSYFRTSHLGWRHTSHFWFRSIVPFL